VPKDDTSTIKMISSPYDSSHAIWVPKHLLTNHERFNKAWIPKLDKVVGGLIFIRSLIINKKIESLLYCQAYELMRG
jgi:hypothetical protein